MKKSQIIITDLLISGSFFIALIAVGLISYENMKQQILLSEASNEIALKINSVVDTIIHERIVSRRNVINESKLGQFYFESQNNYTHLKDSLGLSAYDFSWELSDFNGIIFYSFENEILPLSEVRVALRYVVYNDEPAKFKFVLWKEI